MEFRRRRTELRGRGSVADQKSEMTSTRKAWLVVALLWPVAMLNYLDRQMLATMGMSIKVDIVELQSAAVYGQLMGAFLWVYAFFSPLGCYIADRLNLKWLCVGSLGGGSG